MKFLEKIFSITNKREISYKTKEITIFNLKFPIKKTIEIKSMDIRICDTCNLNCKACSTFSPLIQENNFIDPATHEQNMQILSQKLPVACFHIIGGEPLLHPQLEDLLAITRKYYPKTEIYIITNLLLIKKMPESFWHSMRQHNIKIRYTLYPPLEKNCSSIIDYIRSKGIEPILFTHVKEFFKFFTLEPIDSVNENLQFKKCDWVCPTIKNSKIYPCGFIMEHFNKTFNTHLPENIGLDINTATKEEIADHLQKGIPLCNHCNFDKKVSFPWAISEKKIEEWIIQ